MNYLREINSFYDWLETNSISDSAINLWHALMHINNKAGWITEFTVAISTLETKTGLKKGAIVRARLRLQQAGRVDFKSRTGQQSAIYTIIPFNVDNFQESNLSSLMEHKAVHKPDTNWNANRTQSGTQTGPITKLNGTKLNEKNINDNTREAGLVDKSHEPDFSLLRELEREYGTLSSVEISCLTEWHESFYADILYECFRRYKANGGVGRKYMDTVFINWYKSGVETLEDVQCQDELFKQQKHKQYTPRGKTDNVTSLMEKALGGTSLE